MYRFQLIAVVSLAIVGITRIVSGMPGDDPPASRGVTLLGTLADWQYPGSKMLGGATMSDGGFPGVQSILCKTILTTPDPIDAVIKFYSEKFPLPPVTGPGPGPNPVDAKSVSALDDSQNRPLTLRVIVVNKTHSSTTLVISRAAGEKETHIAWSHFLRLDAPR